MVYAQDIVQNKIFCIVVPSVDLCMNKCRGVPKC